MYKRLLQYPITFKKSFFLLGPRGTGKTMWVKKIFSEALYFDLLKTSTYTELLSDPTKIERKIPSDYTGWVVVDEIQKIPELLNEVHRLIEEKKITFVLTGSSARKLRKKGVNLLAGRAYTFHLYPLTCWEMEQSFDLEYALQWGLLPSLYDDGEDPRLFLRSYVETYLREEVLQEGLTRSIAGFNRFLEAASFSQGEIVNMSAVGRDCSLNRKVVESYFEILQDLLIAYLLPVFSKRAKRKLVTHPKFYYFDVGVYRILRPKGPWDTPELIDGPALETLFLQHLIALNSYMQLDYELFFWRTQTGHEVDFVLYGERGIFAFEIKRSRSVTSKDLRNMKLFLEDYPDARCFHIAAVDSAEYYGNIQVLPYELALKDLPKLIA